MIGSFHRLSVIHSIDRRERERSQFEGELYMYDLKFRDPTSERYPARVIVRKADHLQKCSRAVSSLSRKVAVTLFHPVCQTTSDHYGLHYTASQREPLTLTRSLHVFHYATCCESKNRQSLWIIKSGDVKGKRCETKF